MGYYIRAFCVRQPPPISEVLNDLREQGLEFKVEDETGHGGPGAMPRQHVVRYRASRHPILVEIGERRDPEIQEEIDEFMESVKEEPPSSKRRRVEQHLRASQFVVATQVASEEIDDVALEAAGSLVAAYVTRCGGLVQADGEGFYDGAELLLAVP